MASQAAMSRFDGRLTDAITEAVEFAEWADESGDLDPSSMVMGQSDNTEFVKVDNGKLRVYDSEYRAQLLKARAWAAKVGRLFADLEIAYRDMHKGAQR